MKKTYVIFSIDNGLWYEGRLLPGTRKPIATANSVEDALELNEEEIAEEFPSGLPPGWVKQEA